MAAITITTIIFATISLASILTGSIIKAAEAKCLLLDESGKCLDEGRMPANEQPYTNSSTTNSGMTVPLLIAALSAPLVGISAALYFRTRNKVTQ